MNTSADSTPSAPVEMVLPETFHRLKRTVLVLAGVIVLLGLAVPAETTTLHMTWVDLSLPSDLVRWLLWLAMLYYAWGFGLEVQAARRMNSEVLRVAGLSSFEQYILRTAKAQEDRAGALSTFAEATIESLISRLDSLDQEIMHAPNGLTDVEEDRLKAAMHHNYNQRDQAMILNFIKARLLDVLGPGNADTRGIVSRASSLMELIKAAVVQLREVSANTKALEVQIAAARHELTRLHREIVGARRTSFFVWELGGAGAAVVVATGFLPPVMAFFRALAAA